MRYATMFLCFALVVVTLGCGASDSISKKSTDITDLPFLNTVAADVADSEEMDSEQLMPSLPNPERSNPFAVFEEDTQTPDKAVIELKGFVDRGQVKAVLLVGGSFAVVQEQEVVGGATIVSIRPPQLVYEYDGAEHQLSL